MVTCSICYIHIIGVNRWFSLVKIKWFAENPSGSVGYDSWVSIRFSHVQERVEDGPC